MFYFNLFKHDPSFLELAKGQTLYREGEPGDVMYVIIEGEVQISMGGVVAVQSHLDLIIKEPTLWLDGTELIKDGRLLI
jgi:hypothetical protein